MRIDKSDLLNLSQQPCLWRQKKSQSFTVVLGFDMKTSRLLPPDKIYAAAIKSLSPESCLDMGMPKPFTEWLLAGEAWVSNEQANCGIVSDIRIGKSHRRFVVENQKPILHFPLTWEKTWGNEQENPLGLPPTKIKRAPVIDPALPFGTPACPSSMGAWPCRQKNMNSYDKKWLLNDWPGFPDDFDWSFFNLAQSVQRFEEDLIGNEEIELRNLHKDFQIISSRLPKKHLHLRVQKGDRWFDETLRADTVWLFPNFLAGMIFWHGLVPCEDSNGKDIEAVQVIMEPEEEPLEAEIKPAEIKQEPEDDPKLKDTTLIAAPKAPNIPQFSVATPPPPTIKASPVPEAPEIPTPPQTEAQLLGELNDTFESSIGDINKSLTENGLPPMTSAQINETKAGLAKMAKSISSIQNDIAKQAAQPSPSLESILQQLGLPKQQIASLQAAIDMPTPDPSLFKEPKLWEVAVDKYLEAYGKLLNAEPSSLGMMRNMLLMQGPGGENVLNNLLPKVDPLQQAKEVFAQAGMNQTQITNFLKVLDEDLPSDPKDVVLHLQKLEQAGGFPAGSMTNMYKEMNKSAEALGLNIPEEPKIDIPAPPPIAKQIKMPEAVKMPPVEEIVKEPPLIFSKEREKVITWLEKGMSLEGKDLSGADLSKLDLSGQNLSGTIFSGADLSGTTAKNAVFTDTILDGAKLDKAAFNECTFQKCSIKDITAEAADFSKSSWQDCDMSGSCFKNAKLNNTDFYKVNLDKSDLQNASLNEARIYDVTIRKSALNMANLDKSVWTKTEAHDSIFADVKADKLMFADNNAPRADWTGAVIKNGDFSRSSLNNANMEGINLFQGSMRDADLSGANLSKTNLYGVDLCQAKIDPLTKLNGADYTNTILSAKQAKK